MSSLAVPAGQIVKGAIEDGYAVAGGHVGTPGSGDLLNPAPFFAALRSNWTVAEALAVASPKINSNLRVIADPLAVLPMPLNGYEIYTRPTRAGSDTLVKVAPAGSTSATLTGLAANSSQWARVQAVDDYGLSDTESTTGKLKRLAMDGSALLIAVPNAPTGLSTTPIAGGSIRVAFSYVSNREPAAPSQFNVYIDSGSGFNFGSADATVTATGARSYSTTVGPYADALQGKVVVRAESAAGKEEDNMKIVLFVADNAAPDAPASVEVTVT